MEGRNGKKRRRREGMKGKGERKGGRTDGRKEREGRKEGKEEGRKGKEGRKRGRKGRWEEGNVPSVSPVLLLALSVPRPKEGRRK
jgi:hypothetical protein